MPLPPCRTRKEESAIMFTFGPIDPPDKDAARMEVFNLFKRYIGHNMKPNQFIVAFEVNEEGYHHCHTVVGFIHPQKPPMRLVDAIKEKLCTPDADGRRPNLGMNHVPRLRKGQPGAGKSAYELMAKYLTDPHKTKVTDDGALEFTFPEVIDHAAVYRRLADKEPCAKKARWYEYQHALAVLRNDVTNPKPKKARRTQAEADAARAVELEQEKMFAIDQVPC